MLEWGIFAALALGAGALASRRVIGFESQKPAHYSEATPKLDLRTHLSGPIDCEGVIYGPLGRVTSRFVAKMQGDWQGPVGTLAEDFTYGDGSTQQRKWHLTIGNGPKFTATADDIIGKAQGEVAGNSIRMTYRIRLPQEAGGHVLDVTDWIYLTDNGVMMNRSQMRKFGIKVAELIATMRPASPPIIASE